MTAFHSKLVEMVRLYYFIGGMPEVVAEYIETKNLETVRALQKIVLGYENDFSKYAPNDIVSKIRLVWRSIVSQLAKERGQSKRL